MELTAKTLDEVQFGAKVRGYDPAEVDEFLHAVGQAVEELQERLRRSNERAARAEQQAAVSVTAQSAPAAEPIDSGQSLRILEMAQRTADAYLEDARVEAERIKQEAVGLIDRASAETEHIRREASGLIEEARAGAATIAHQARDDAERVAAQAQSRLRSDISALESAREHLKSDVDALGSYLDEERSRLRSTLSKALAALDEHADVPVAPPVVANVYAPAQPPTNNNPPDDEEDQSQASGDDGGGTANPSWGSESHWAPDGESWQPHQEPETPYGPSGYAEEAAAAARHTEQPSSGWGESAWGKGDGRYEAPAAGSGSYARFEDDDAGNSDPFLAELRRAVHDDHPLGPRDDFEDDTSIESLYSSDDDSDGDRGSFFRRKR